VGIRFLGGTIPVIDHKTERESDINIIKAFAHPKKVVVAGPGTGKSFLFQELIKAKKEEGKTDFIAITFIGKLCDALQQRLTKFLFMI